MIALNKRKILIILSTAILLAIIIFLIGLFIFLPKKSVQPKVEEKPPPIEKEKTEEILERLTPKESKLLTEEEKKKLEEVLKKLTPTKTKPLTEKEEKELNELLKQLTPQ